MGTRTRTRTATTTHDVRDLILYRYGPHSGSMLAERVQRVHIDFDIVACVAHIMCEVSDAMMTEQRRALAADIDAHLGYHLPLGIGTTTRCVPEWPFADDEPESVPLGG